IENADGRLAEIKGAFRTKLAVLRNRGAHSLLPIRWGGERLGKRIEFAPCFWIPAFHLRERGGVDGGLELGGKRAANLVQALCRLNVPQAHLAGASSGGQALAVAEKRDAANGIHVSEELAHQLAVVGIPKADVGLAVGPTRAIAAGNQLG